MSSCDLFDTTAVSSSTGEIYDALLDLFGVSITQVLNSGSGASQDLFGGQHKLISR